MFWSRVVFEILGDAILRIDGFLVGIILKTPRTGNAAAFADGWGHFWIAPECSALSNVSIAILLWVLLRQSLPAFRGLRPNHCMIAAMAVVVLNTIRLGLTGLSRAHYEVLHGPTGSAVFGWGMLATIAAIYLVAGRRSLARLHVPVG
jgi:hypothetical protein